MNTIFKNNEAEEMVKEMRAHLRMAEQKENVGEQIGAVTARKQADTILIEILNRLAPRIDRYAVGSFFGKNAISVAETREDARCTIIFLLCQRLRDLRNKPGAKFYETKFNAAVKCCFIDAIRRVRREQDLDNEGNVASSLDETLAIDENGDTGESLIDTIECEEATRAMNKVLGDDMAADFLEQLTQQTSANHTRVFYLRLANLTWDEIAERVSITDRTARTYYNTSVSLLRRFMADA